MKKESRQDSPFYVSFVSFLFDEGTLCEPVSCVVVPCPSTGEPRPDLE